VSDKTEFRCLSCRHTKKIESQSVDKLRCGSCYERIQKNTRKSKTTVTTRNRINAHGPEVSKILEAKRFDKYVNIMAKTA
jgi:transcription elongation factor Elf1